ncbi:MAG: hypothetical protein JKY99_05455 [Rhizobiales bacterium]|nr:hypothetical protein [Hyphomicrobiales bacterium]
MFPNIVAEEPKVVSFLNGLRLPRQTMLEILSSTSGERANVRASDPKTAKGYETWRWGTRFCRESEDLAALGWIACEHNQIDGIRNDDLRVKLVVCNMNANAGNADPTKQPKNTNKKGSANCVKIEGNSPQLTMGFPTETHTNPLDLYDFWYFGVHISDKQISAEVCRANSESGGFITSFSDRIILAKPGELPGLKAFGSVEEDFAEVQMPSVIRKPR